MKISHQRKRSVATNLYIIVQLIKMQYWFKTVVVATSGCVGILTESNFHCETTEIVTSIILEKNEKLGVKTTLGGGRPGWPMEKDHGCLMGKTWILNFRGKCNEFIWNGKKCIFGYLENLLNLFGILKVGNLYQGSVQSNKENFYAWTGGIGILRENSWTDPWKRLKKSWEILKKFCQKIHHIQKQHKNVNCPKIIDYLSNV